MTQMSSYLPGTFCWVELGTTDSKGAVEFYTLLFGWEALENPVGSGLVYTILTSNELDVAGLYPMNPEQQAQNIPPHWLSYISVASADESARKAEGLGGRLIVPPFDVPDLGRMAVLQDPTGAVFALWEARGHIGARLVNEPVSLCWNELVTGDTKAAGKFYTGLFGWSERELPMGEDLRYTSFMNQDRPAAGMMQIRPEWGEVPPHWAVYFAVESCDNTAEKARGLKGAVVSPPQDVPGVGRFATLKDPQGAYFSIIKLT